MKKYFLYYAGMANDMVNEQIGLAISDDGINYKKVRQSGLIIPRDENNEWKSLRVCNPTVLKSNDEFVMFYQGISSKKPHNIEIGIALSKNGIDWECEREPILKLEDLKNFDQKIELVGRNGLIEPSLVCEDGMYKMWFVHLNNGTNEIYYAESQNNKSWKIMHKTNASNAIPANYKIHYPQVLKEDNGYRLYFTLVSQKKGIYGIFTLFSKDGISFKDLKQISFVDTNDGEINLKEKNIFYKLYAKFLGNVDFYAGISHSHIMEINSEKYICYHSYNRDKKRGIYMDIGIAKYNGEKLKKPIKILKPESCEKNAWDSFFVADPYILEV